MRQADLAEIVGRTPSTIAHIERGALQPSAKLVIELAAALDVDPADLMTAAEVAS